MVELLLSMVLLGAALVSVESDLLQAASHLCLL